MYLHFNMRRMKCVKHSDAGTYAEYYHTWQVRCPEGKTQQLAQGFSLGCPADTGYSLKEGQSRELNDPRFTVQLPEVEDGTSKHVEIDLWAWESDYTSQQVKALFSNAGAQKLLEIQELAETRRDEAIQNLRHWVQDEDQNQVIGALIAAGVSNLSPYVAAAKAVVQVFFLVLDLIKANSDDLVGHARAELILSRQNDKLSYRWIFNDGVETWFDKEEAPIFQDWRALEANQRNDLRQKFHLQLISERDKRLL